MSNPVYLAGPMTGIPQFNYPAFDTAAEYLRGCGWDICSPAEMDDMDTRDAAMASEDGALLEGQMGGHTWGDFLSRDVKLIADTCGGIIVLDGWEKSKGARLEVYVAIQCGYPLYHYRQDGLVMSMPVEAALQKICSSLLDYPLDLLR